MTQTMDQLRNQIDHIQDILAETEELDDEASNVMDITLQDTYGLAGKARDELLSVGEDDPVAYLESAKYYRVGALLHNNTPAANEAGYWPFLEEAEGEPVDIRNGNKFFLGAIIDYRQNADRAWEAARQYAEDQLGDPDDLWRQIAAIPAERWNSDAYRQRCGLHRFKQAHKRVHDIAGRIVERYDGDVRNLWLNQNFSEVIKRLNQISAGKELSKMIAGALSDTGQLQGIGDLRADLQVRRVLGRIFSGAPVNEAEAHRIASAIAPDGSWIIDAPLYWHGKDTCSAEPACDACYLWFECEYFANVQTSVPR